MSLARFYPGTERSAGDASSAPNRLSANLQMFRVGTPNETGSTALQGVLRAPLRVTLSGDLRHARRMADSDPLSALAAAAAGAGAPEQAATGEEREETRLVPGNNFCGSCAPSSIGQSDKSLDALEAACWGAQLRGDASLCSPGFAGGTAHFKNKFCPACKTGSFEIPVSHIRALPRSWHPDAASLDLKLSLSNGHSVGFWKTLPDGDGRFRFVNNTLDCAGPQLVVFREMPKPQLQWGVLPERWVENGFVTLQVAKGTLVPRVPMAALEPELWRGGGGRVSLTAGGVAGEHNRAGKRQRGPNPLSNPYSAEAQAAAAARPPHGAACAPPGAYCCAPAMPGGYLSYPAYASLGLATPDAAAAAAAQAAAAAAQAGQLHQLAGGMPPQLDPSNGNALLQSLVMAGAPPPAMPLNPDGTPHQLAGAPPPAIFPPGLQPVPGMPGGLIPAGPNGLPQMVAVQAGPPGLAPTAAGMPTQIVPSPSAANPLQPQGSSLPTSPLGAPPPSMQPLQVPTTLPGGAIACSGAMMTGQAAGGPLPMSMLVATAETPTHVIKEQLLQCHKQVINLTRLLVERGGQHPEIVHPAERSSLEAQLSAASQTLDALQALWQPGMSAAMGSTAMVPVSGAMTAAAGPSMMAAAGPSASTTAGVADPASVKPFSVEQ